MKQKPSIVFVDDQNNILQGFRRSLRGLEDTWDIHYLIGGKETLRLMETMHVDIIVADTNMPGMRGTELLTEVRNLYPETIRLVLSGGGSRSDDISILLRSSHQFFSKPFDIEKLKSTVDRLLALRDRIGDDNMQKLVASVSKLPCSPRIYAAFKKEREASSADLDKLGGFIAQDPGLTAKMLQSLNSTFFGVNKAGIHPYKAAQSMGPGTINYLFDEDTHFHTLERSHPNYDFIGRTYKQSLHCALLVETLAKAENLPENLQNVAYTTGMLSMIGSAILAFGMADEYAKIVPGFKSVSSQLAAEKKAFGVPSTVLGAYFLGLWGFPEATCDAAAYGPTPDKSALQGFSLTALVHVAQAMVQTDDFDAQKAQVNLAYLEKIGVAGKLQKWHDIDRDDVRSQPLLKEWSFD